MSAQEGYLPWGCLGGGGVCLPDDWCLSRGCLPRRGCIPPPSEQTDTCKNVTFPQLLLRTVKMDKNSSLSSSVRTDPEWPLKHINIVKRKWAKLIIELL